MPFAPMGGKSANCNNVRYGCLYGLRGHYHHSANDLNHLRGHHDHSQKQHIRCFSVPRPPQIEVAGNINRLCQNSNLSFALMSVSYSARV